GPGDQQHRLFKYLKRMDDRRPFILLDQALANWRWSRGYLENVAQAIALAVLSQQATGRIYNVADTTAFTEAEWVRQIARTHGWEGQVVALPGDQLPTSLRSEAFDFSQQYVVDTSRIRRELGYSEDVPLDEALRRTIVWERAHPPETIDQKEFDYAAEDAVLARLTLIS